MPVGPLAEVDAYLAKLPDDQRKALQKLRAQIRRAAPAAEEGMGYGLAGFYQDGPLVYYGAMKGHCGIYGKVPETPASLVRDLAPYASGKGTLRFLPDARPSPLPSWPGWCARAAPRTRPASGRPRPASHDLPPRGPRRASRGRPARQSNLRPRGPGRGRPNAEVRRGDPGAMPAYVLVDVDVKDPAAYAEYRAKAPPAIAAHGGRYIVRGGHVEHIEPGWDLHRGVILEFPTAAAFHGWYKSPEYQRILPIRLRSTRSRMVLLEGLDPKAPVPP